MAYYKLFYLMYIKLRLKYQSTIFIKEGLSFVVFFMMIGVK